MIDHAKEKEKKKTDNTKPISGCGGWEDSVWDGRNILHAIGKMKEMSSHLKT